jgi:hypothetical protein
LPDNFEENSQRSDKEERARGRAYELFGNQDSIDENDLITLAFKRNLHIEEGVLGYNRLTREDLLKPIENEKLFHLLKQAGLSVTSGGNFDSIISYSGSYNHKEATPLKLEVSIRKMDDLWEKRLLVEDSNLLPSAADEELLTIKIRKTHSGSLKDMFVFFIKKLK